VELRHVRYFLAVADERSFTRAAEKLNVAQSPLSQQIRKLERELGVDLFYRTTRSVQLTHAGQVFYDQMRTLIANAEGAIEATRKTSEGALGHLSVGFTGSASYELLPAVVRAYTSRFPDVTLDLHTELVTPEQVAGLQTGQLAVGLLRPPVHADGIAVEIVRNEPTMILLPSRHRASIGPDIDLVDLRDEWFIAYSHSPPSTMYGLMVSACQQAGFTPKIRHMVTNSASLVTLVAAGLGVALVPASLRHLKIDGATYRPLRSPQQSVALAIAYRADETNPLVRRFVETARAVIGSREHATVPPRLAPEGDSADYLPPAV
jgi:DNA-binding transcriptional LysR family regulator